MLTSNLETSLWNILEVLFTLYSTMKQYFTGIRVMIIPLHFSISTYFQACMRGRELEREVN